MYWPGCSNQPRVDFSYHKNVPSPICLLICAPTHPPTLSYPRSYWTIPYHRDLRGKALIRNLFFFSEMDFHLRRKIRQVSIIRPNSLCFLLPLALSKKTMAAPQHTMLVFKFSFQFASQMINTTLDSVWKFLKVQLNENETDRYFFQDFLCITLLIHMFCKICEHDIFLQEGKSKQKQF